MKRRAMPKKLGKKLRLIRERLGMSQRQIVKALKYSATPLQASQISQYENGQREPTMMLVLAYARLANVSTDFLIDDKLDVPLVLGPTTGGYPKKGSKRSSGESRFDGRSD